MKEKKENSFRRRPARCGFTKCCISIISIVIVLIAVLVGLVASVHVEENFLPRCIDSKGNEYLCEIPPVTVPSTSMFANLKQYSQQGALFIANSFIETIFFYLGSNSLPNPTQQEITIKGISDIIRIQRDSNGIPHITAKTLRDGIFAQGYAEASDRLYQFEINRRLCSGRLSEIFGDKARGTDRFARALGFYRLNNHNGSRYHQESMEEPFKSRIDTLDYVKAFVAGINNFIESDGFKMPMEFTLLGVKQLEKFTVEDIQCWIRFNTFTMSKGWSREISLSLIQNTLGSARDFVPDYSEIFPVNMGTRKENNSEFPTDREPTTKHSSKEFNFPEAMRVPEEILRLPVGAFGGSNAFAISGNFTKSGKPILAGDPHLPSIQPSMWYQWNLVIDGNEKEQKKISGVSANFVPFFVLMRTNDFSTTVTLANTDVDDTYIVRFLNSSDPDKLFYEHEGEIIEAEVVTEEIFSNESASEEIRIIYTKYGVVISDALGLNVTADGIVTEKQKKSANSPYHYKLALRSNGLHPTIMKQWNLDHSIIGFSANAILARNIDEFEKAVSFLVSPPLNFVYADTEGNIGHFVSGRISKRKNPSDGILPARGWLNENEWDGFMSWDEMPRYKNPEKGFIVSSNNKICDLYPTKNTWSQGFRALRLEELIQTEIDSGMKISLDTAKLIQQDHLSLIGLELQKRFFSIPGISSHFCGTQDTEDDKLLCNSFLVFQKWNGTMNVNSAGACIYEATFAAATLHLLLPLTDSLSPVCMGMGYQPVINPTTELVASLPTVLFNMMDASNITSSDLTKSLQPTSSKWINSCDGVENLLLQSFTKASRWLAAKFIKLHSSNSFNVSEWRWGDIHHTKYSHNLGAISPLVDRVLSPESEAHGDAETVAMSQVVPFKYSFDQKGWGVSFRQLHDMAEDSLRFSITPPGNCGQYGSIGYSATLADFSAGKLHQNNFPLSS